MNCRTHGTLSQTSFNVVSRNVIQKDIDTYISLIPISFCLRHLDMLTKLCIVFVRNVRWQAIIWFCGWYSITNSILLLTAFIMRVILDTSLYTGMLLGHVWRTSNLRQDIWVVFNMVVIDAFIPTRVCLFFLL